MANDLTSDSQIEGLGKALGVPLSDIGRCLQTNQKGPGVTSRGTLGMLRDWLQTVHEGEEIATLWAALTKAKLIRIAEKHLDGMFVKNK